MFALNSETLFSGASISSISGTCLEECKCCMKIVATTLQLFDLGSRIFIAALWHRSLYHILRLLTVHRTFAVISGNTIGIICLCGARIWCSSDQTIPSPDLCIMLWARSQRKKPNMSMVCHPPKIVKISSAVHLRRGQGACSPNECISIRMYLYGMLLLLFEMDNE